jgi:hypothetical protein
MADIKRDQSFDDEPLDRGSESQGRADLEDEAFDEEEDFEDEEEELDEDLDTERGAMDRNFTAEIGSEGGSQGDLEKEQRRPHVTRGSEASSTALPADVPSFHDRHAGGGMPSGDRERE